MHSNPNVSSCPAFLPDIAQRSWAALDRSAETAVATFDPDSIGMLPAPVIRWLRHTIAPGTPLSAGVEVSMHGEIRIKKWLPFTAQQIVSPTGYIWAAEAGRFPMNFRGYDRYSDDIGHMSWKLYGHIPLVNATGSDIDRSAAGRLASEMIGLTPAGALSPNVTWTAIDDHHALATIIIDKQSHQVTIDVDDEGKLRSVSLRYERGESERLAGSRTLAVRLMVHTNDVHPVPVEGIEELLIEQRVRHRAGQEHNRGLVWLPVPDREHDRRACGRDDDLTVRVRALHRVEQQSTSSVDTTRRWRSPLRSPRGVDGGRPSDSDGDTTRTFT
jgi:hypothetical protein